MSTLRPKLLSSIVLLALSAPTLAAGFHVTTHSASGLGRAYAGEGVMGDTAAVLARNPAAMTLFDQTAFSAGVTVAEPTTSVSGGDLDGVVDLPAQEGLAATKNIPNLFLIVPVTPDLSLGLAAFSNFGTGTEFTDEYNSVEVGTGSGIGGNLFGGTTSITTINANASVAYRLTESLSLGVGVDVIQGEGLIERPGILEYEGDGIATSWDAGLMLEFGPSSRLGLAYRSGVSIETEGEGNFQTAGLDKLVLNLPSIAEFSGLHWLGDSFAVHYSAQYIGWSAFDKLAFSGDTSYAPEYNWEDSWRYSVGSTLSLSPSFTLRAGAALDRTPVPADNRKIAIIDSDRIWYSAGATYAFTDATQIDLGVTYLQGEELLVEEVNNDFTNTATSDLSAILAGVQFSMLF